MSEADNGGKVLKVALLGCGSVGSQVVRLLTEQAGDLAARVGAPVELVGVAVRDGVSTVVVRRETEDDLLATDVGAHGAPVMREDGDMRSSQ